MKSTRGTWMLAALAIATAALVAAGCGGSKGGEGAAPKSEQVFNFNIASDIQSFDPSKVSYLETVNVINQMFGGLYRIVGDHGDVVPYLAESLPEISKDGLTYTVKLRPGLMWSDGKPLTADDVVFGVQHSLDPATGAAYASVMLDIVGACEYNSSGPLGEGEKPGDDAAACDGLKTDRKPESVAVTAVDDTTVQYKLERPVPWFTSLLTMQEFYPLPKHVVEKYGDKWTDVDNYVTSGPFKLSAYKVRKSITLAKNPEFFNADKVKLQKVNLRMVKEPSTANKLFTLGKLDGGQEGSMFSATEIDRWKKDKRFLYADASATTFVYLNTTNPALKDPKVRQGIAQAIDRSKITEKVRRVGDTPINTIIPNSMPYYDMIKEGSQDFLGQSANVSKAKELLAEGGWTPGTTLNYYYTVEGSSTAQRVSESIQADLAKAGVKLKLVTVPGDSFYDTGIGTSPTGPKVDLLIAGWQADYLDAQNFYQLFTCANVDAGLNSANYCDPKFDELYKDAIVTVDEDARAGLYKKMEAMLTGPDGTMPAIPLYQPRGSTLIQPWVKGFKLSSSGLYYFDDIEIASH